jgi:hypothetical protein
MFKKNGQFSVEFLLIFVFMMSVVSILIVVLGTISIEISLDEKRQEVDDFANSILKEFEIMQSVEGGYFRNFEVPSHFMDRFNIRVDGEYLTVSDLYSYNTEVDFIRFYKIPGGHIVDTNYDVEGNFIISLCKNFPNEVNSVDFFSVAGINDNYCFDKLAKDYITFSPNSTDLTIVGGNTRLDFELTSNTGTNIIYLRDFESGVLLEHEFGQFDAPLTLNFETNLTGDYVFVSFKEAGNVNVFKLENNGVVNANFGLIY